MHRVGIARACQNLEVCHPSLTLQLGCLIQHSMNALAGREHGPSNLLLVALKLRSEGNYGDIPDDMKVIRESAQVLLWHYSLQLLREAHCLISVRLCSIIPMGPDLPIFSGSFVVS